MPRSTRQLWPHLRFSHREDYLDYEAFVDRYGYSRARRATSPPRPRPAAGILLRHTDDVGETWWLLGLRHAVLGGVWSNLGGSLDAGEDALAGALREVYEEAGLTAAELADATLAATIDCGDDAVPYTLFVLDVPDFIDGLHINWEHDDLAWFPTEEVARLDLHHGFATAWEQLR